MNRTRFQRQSSADCSSNADSFDRSLVCGCFPLYPDPQAFQNATLTHQEHQAAMMRPSVSHPSTPPKPARNCRLQWCVLLAIGALTVLTGISVLVALMSPENLRSVPTVALVCVLVLLCVPVPVLMLERSHRRSAAANLQSTESQQPTASESTAHAPRQAIIHASHQPHDSSADTHRPSRSHNEQHTAAAS